MAVKYYVVVFAVIFGTCRAQFENLSNISESVTLPEQLEDIDHKVVEMLQNKTTTELKARCDKYGGPEAYNKLEMARTQFTECVSSLVNTTTLQEEIETAKPDGSVDEVFKKYCGKKPQLENCLLNLTEASKECFSSQEQSHLKTIYNVTEELAKFVCYKDGDRIALFIADGGQECFQEKRVELQECGNKTLGVQDGLNMNSVAELTIAFDEKQCKQILDLQTCVVKVLESCPKPTTANIVESLFKFVRKATPCKNYMDENSESRSQKAEPPKSSATSLYITSATIFTALAAKLIV